MQTESGQTVAAVVRALSLLQCFRREAPVLALAEISRETGLYKSTVLRLLQTLESEGFILRHQDGRYSLGAAVARLGSVYEASIDLHGLIMPILRSISDETLETATFDVQDGDHRLCVGRIAGRHPVRDHPVDGAILPLGKGASGRVLQDYAQGPGDRHGTDLIYVSLGERHPEMAGISIPIFGRDNSLTGSLCITGTVARYSDAEYLGRLKAVLLARAGSLSTALGGDVSRYRSLATEGVHPSAS